MVIFFRDHWFRLILKGAGGRQALPNPNKMN